MKKVYVFFRNDDVRDSLDETLVQITDVFIRNKIPICHAVEPANVSQKVILWLLDLKRKYPELIEIVQHGYNHKLNYSKTRNGKIKKGEFGGDRTYEEQYREIKRGKELMDEYFGDNWFPLFTFPYGARNDESIRAINELGFKAVNGSKGIGVKSELFYCIGHLMQKEMLLGHKISWDLKFKPHTKLFQIDTSISVINKFLDEDKNCEFYSLKELMMQTDTYMQKNKTIGYVLHHRYEKSQTINQLEELILFLKNKSNIEFCTQESIYEQFSEKR